MRPCHHSILLCALDAGLVEDNNYCIETLAGDLNVKLENGFVMMDILLIFR